MGIPTLDLTWTRESLVSFSNPSGDSIRLSTGGYLNFPIYSVVIDGIEGTLRSGILVIGQQVTAVPEAPSLAVFVLGLAGLIFLHRRGRPCPGAWPSGK